jgi:hypothetical protein
VDPVPEGPKICGADSDLDPDPEHWLILVNVVGTVTIPTGPLRCIRWDRTDTWYPGLGAEQGVKGEGAK